MPRKILMLFLGDQETNKPQVLWVLSPRNAKNHKCYEVHSTTSSFVEFRTRTGVAVEQNIPSPPRAEQSERNPRSLALLWEQRVFYVLPLLEDWLVYSPGDPRTWHEHRKVNLPRPAFSSPSSTHPELQTSHSLISLQGGQSQESEA